MMSFKEKPKLYHYTSLKSLAEILKYGVLKFGVLPKMNDITEAVKDIFIQSDKANINWETIVKIEERLNHVGMISLTQDGLIAGYAINSMWGHYAEKGEGCCLIFDKNRIVEECNKLGLKYGSIIYDEPVSHIISDDNQDDLGLLETEFEKIFLYKSIDWKPEQEFRIVNLRTTKDIEGLPIINSIIAIVFHTNCRYRVFGCPVKQNNISLLNDIPALEYIYSNMWEIVKTQCLLIPMETIGL